MRSSREVCLACARPLEQPAQKKDKQYANKRCDQSEITQAVNECMYHIRRSLNPNEAASMFYGVFSCTNPELCCAFMERLKHEHHASWVTVCENFKTEALDTYA